MNYDEMTWEEYQMIALLKGKSRMEIDQILGDEENGKL